MFFVIDKNNKLLKVTKITRNRRFLELLINLNYSRNSI